MYTLHTLYTRYTRGPVYPALLCLSPPPHTCPIQPRGVKLPGFFGEWEGVKTTDPSAVSRHPRHPEWAAARVVKAECAGEEQVTLAGFTRARLSQPFQPFQPSTPPTAPTYGGSRGDPSRRCLMVGVTVP